MDMRPPILKRCILWTVLLLLSACAGSANFKPINVPGTSENELVLHRATIVNKPDDYTAVALAFSGGGMRASAFSYGVLKTFSTIPIDPAGKKNLTDAVDFISGVSGGSVTAAYFALKGPEGFDDFRQNFLDKNAEEGLRTKFSINNIIRILTFGGANDRSNFPLWLNENLFHGATYAEVLEKKRPVLWISASDIFNRTPFVFSGIIFRPLCSSLSKVHLADAVSASAAVPGAFTPLNVESFADQCAWQEPTWSSEKTGLYYGQEAMLEAARRYRDPTDVKYIKLMDGGLTDNFGIAGITLARLSQQAAYAPINKERAIKLKRLLFVVVNSGRGPVEGEWNRALDNPNLMALASAITDTAIDSNVRATFDLFKIVMNKWNEDLIKWRCSLTKTEVETVLGDSKNWKCDDVKFFVTQFSFAGAGAERKERLDNIPTRFALPADDIKFLIESAAITVKNNETFNKFLQDLL